jgi:ABC-type polysaccharide/polyol phosphate export permease
VSPGLDNVLKGLGIAALTFLVGYFLFKRMESDFADRI